MIDLFSAVLATAACALMVPLVIAVGLFMVIAGLGMGAWFVYKLFQ